MAMPTEHISRYFQVASMERALRLKYISGAMVTVVVSSATHRSPRCWDTVTSVMAERHTRSAMQRMRLDNSFLYRR